MQPGKPKAGGKFCRVIGLDWSQAGLLNLGTRNWRKYSGGCLTTPLASTHQMLGAAQDSQMSPDIVKCARWTKLALAEKCSCREIAHLNLLASGTLFWSWALESPTLQLRLNKDQLKFTQNFRKGKEDARSKIRETVKPRFFLKGDKQQCFLSLQFNLCVLQYVSIDIRTWMSSIPPPKENVGGL